MDTNYNELNAGLGSVATNTVVYVNSILSNPIVVIILIVIIVIYIIMFWSLGSSEITSNSSGTSYNTLIIAILIMVFVLTVMRQEWLYVFGLNIVAKIKNIFTGGIDIVVDNSRIDASNAPVPEILLTRQVFNIPDNNYIYPDAKAICKAYGAELATYQQVENSYNSGGEWCNYGWSEGQMALFPTQQKTYDELQKIEGHENDCGRPGINGGYMSNPLNRYGVNCYGYKPKITQDEEYLMENELKYPKTKKDIAMEKRVDYWKNKLPEVIISPFNHNRWSKI